MKLIKITGLLFASTIVLGAATTASAVDTKEGTTTVSSTLTEGDITLTTPATLAFGEKEFTGSTVEFDPQIIDYTIINKKGSYENYDLVAKISTELDGTLTMETKTLSLADALIVEKADKQGTDNITASGSITSTLALNGTAAAGDHGTTITWTLAATGTVAP